MRRPVLIATAMVAAAAVCAGCASSNHIATTGSAAGSPSAAPPPSGVVGGSASAGQISPGSPMPPSSPLPGVPLPSYAPTGPAASAATGPPPLVATHAVATVDGSTVACPIGTPYADQAPGQSAPPLAPGVQIKAVVRCETVQRSYAGLGEWQVQLAEVADSGLAPFLTALRQPSVDRPTDIICPLYLLLAPWFALVDSNGAVLHPALPTNQCGQISGAAIAALNKLDFRAVDAVRTQQVASAPLP